MMFRSFVPIVGLATFLAMTSISPALAEKERLPQAEVTRFIGKSWRSSSGYKFHFRNDGTYSYGDKIQGKWKLLPDGRIKGQTTTYTFYREGNTFYYKNTKSGAWWKIHL